MTIAAMLGLMIVIASPPAISMTGPICYVAAPAVDGLTGFGAVSFVSFRPSP